MDASDLTFDEAATYFVAHRPLPDIIAYLRQAVREHPPLYYLLMRVWMSLTGTSEYSLRFFAAGASLAGVALTARVARGLARRFKVGDVGQVLAAPFLPALIMTLFPLEVYYARDARMYTLVLVWVALSSLIFLPLLFDREPKTGRRALVGLVLVNAVTVFTHYYLVLLLVTQWVSLLLLRRWRALLAWSAAHGLAALVGLGWLARSPGLSSSLTEAWGRFDPTWPTWGQLRRLLAELLFGPIRGVPWDLIYSWGALVGLGLLAVWLRSAKTDRGREERPAHVIGVWLTVTTLLPIALAFLMPEPPRARYLIFLLPFAALALGHIPWALSDNKKIALVWLGMLTLAISNLGIYGLPRTVKWIKSTYGQTVAVISAHARPGDGVLFYGPWQWAQYYYYQPDEFPPIASLPPSAPPQLVPNEAEPVLLELLSTYQRLWVIPASVQDVDPDHFVHGWLSAQAHQVWATPNLSLYLPPAEPTAFSQARELTFGDNLRFEHLASDLQTVPAGESVRLTLTWVVSDALESDVKFDFSLVDEQGYRWQQWHAVPGQWSSPPSTWKAGDVITDRQGVIVPQGAPPGIFRIQLSVIDERNGAALQPANADGPLPQPGIDLFTFQVSEPATAPVLIEIGDFSGPFAFGSPNGATDTLTLAGYDLGGLKFQQGNLVPLRLHWLAPADPLPELEMRLELWHRPQLGLLGNQATLLVTKTMALVPGYPVTGWPPGRLVSLPTALPIPDDATPGSAELKLVVLGPDDQRWAIDGSSHLTLGTLTVQERPMLRKLPRGLATVNVDFSDSTRKTGDRIGLRGYRIDGEARPGGQLQLNYAWYALSHPERVYSVFNHLLTTDGQSITQADGWPQNGAVLTKQWRSGEYIPDRHTLEIPADAPPGPYLLAVGLYDVATAERLQVTHQGQPLPNDQWLVPIGDTE